MEDEQFSVLKAAEELKISQEIYLRILGKAIDQTQADLTELKLAHSENNIEIIQALSHRFKGDYANLRVMNLSNVSAQLNVLAKENYSADQAEILIEEFL